MVNLIKTTRQSNARWHIPRDQADLEEEEMWMIRVLCGDIALFDGRLPDGWVKSSDDLAVENICNRCLACQMAMTKAA